MAHGPAGHLLAPILRRSGLGPSFANAKYRTFNGSTDLVTWSLGNLSGASANPQTFVAVTRLLSSTGDCELMFSPGYDPVDWFYNNGSLISDYWDGATASLGPSWNPAGQPWRFTAFRSVSGSASKWSMSTYNGSSWPTPTHTTEAPLGNRSYGTSGVITMGGTPPMNVDIVLIARFNTDLSDAQINAMTGGIAAIQATPGLTNLWLLGQATPTDLVGTSTLGTLTGTTLSAGSPFPTGLYGDDFNRADGAASGWLCDSGAFTIASNRLARQSGGNDFAIFNQNVGSPDMVAEVDIYSGGEANGGSGSVYVCLDVRSSSSYGQNCYMGYFNPTGSGGFSRSWDIAKMVGGSFSPIFSADATGQPYPTAGSRLRFEVQGSALRLYLDGVLKVSTTDTTHTTGNYAGVNVNYASPLTSFDNFACGTIAPSGGITRTARGKAQTAAGGAITLSATSSAFVPAAGSVLVAYLTADYEVGPGIGGGTWTDTFGVSDTFGDSGGGSWTQVALCTRGARVDSSYLESVAVWCRIVGTGPSSGAISISSTYDPGAHTTSGDGWLWGSFDELAGANTSSLIGGSTGSTGRQTAGSTSFALDLGASPASGSFIATILHQDNSTTPATVPSGLTQVAGDNPAFGNTSQSAFKNGSGTQTLSWTGCDTAANLLAVAVEFKSAGGAAPNNYTETGLSIPIAAAITPVDLLNYRPPKLRGFTQSALVLR